MGLNPDEQDHLLSEFQNLKDASSYGLSERHVKQLDNKQGTCHHCGSLQYKKNESTPKSR